MASTELDPSALARARTLSHVPWCAEYEKMISGMLYDSFVPELEGARYSARVWCQQYNTWFPNPSEFPPSIKTPSEKFRYLVSEREKMLSDILGKVGPECTIEPPFTVDYGCNVILGRQVYFNFNCTILDTCLVSIGDRVMFGPGVSIYAATHEVEIESRRKNIEYGKEVWIGNDCWIGGNTVILPGVNIGKGCTIGAGSVVTKSIEDWSVAVGSPCRVIKKVKPVDDVSEGEALGPYSEERSGDWVDVGVRGNKGGIVAPMHNGTPAADV